MDTSDTTDFRRRCNSCYKPIAMIAVIAGVYVSIVSVLRFGRFLANVESVETALPSDNGMLPSRCREDISSLHRGYHLALILSEVMNVLVLVFYNDVFSEEIIFIEEKMLQSLNFREVSGRKLLTSLYLGIYFRIIVNWTLTSSYLYLPSIVGVVVERIGNLCGLPDCYFKFTKIVLLLSFLNGVIGFWQKIPEICLWNLNISYHAEIIHFYLHCSMWIISFMIMLAIDITEITGLKPIFHYYLINENYSSLKSRQFDRFLSNLAFPGSSCLLIMLWSQKIMSFDRLLLAVIWTIGILSYNQTDDKDIKYVAKQIEKKKAWMYYSERITCSPLK